MLEFSAVIYKVGINPCVDIPERVSRTFGIRGNIPVTGALNGLPIRATLVPIGEGRHRLYINGEMRRRARVNAGDRINLRLELDTTPRMLPLPKPLDAALKENETAGAAWERLTPSHRKEILAYLNWLKTPESLERNVKKVITVLLRTGSKRASRPRRSGR